MEAEHCRREGCNYEFESSNYKIKTCPAKEWDITVNGNFGAADQRFDRKLEKIEKLMKKNIVKSAGLEQCEVISVVLYTGPMVRYTSFC